MLQTSQIKLWAEMEQGLNLGMQPSVETEQTERNAILMISLYFLFALTSICLSELKRNNWKKAINPFQMKN